MTAAAGSAREWAAETRRWRWPLAAFAVLIAVALAVLGMYNHAAVICRDAVASTRTVRLCAPPSTAQIALLFIPALLLVMPDLSEVNLLGFGFKRDLEEAREKVDATRGTTNAQVEGLIAAVARLDQRAADAGDVRGIATRVDDLELASANDTTLLREALQAIAGLDDRLRAIDGRLRAIEPSSSEPGS
jgi:hypothetical protein